MSDEPTEEQVRKVANIIHAAVTCALQDFDVSTETITGDVELFEGSQIAARAAIAEITR